MGPDDSIADSVVPVAIDVIMVGSMGNDMWSVEVRTGLVVRPYVEACAAFIGPLRWRWSSSSRNGPDLVLVRSREAFGYAFHFAVAKVPVWIARWIALLRFCV